MTATPDREHYLPIRVSDLIGLLCDGSGSRAPEPVMLSRGDAADFRRLALLVRQYYHLHFNQQLQRMKDAYAPFDPDRETVQLKPLPDAQRAAAMEQLFADTCHILQKANYVRLSRPEVQKLIEGASYWGLEMDVAWDLFERLEVFYRGDTIGRRTRRKWWKLFRKEEVDVAEFSRLVVILKQRPHRRLRKDADLESVFIKLFKDLPRNDLEMVLPGTRVRLTRIDQGLIFYPLAMGITWVLYAILQSIFHFQNILTGIFSSVAVTWSLAVGFAGYAYRSYYSYTVKKTAYSAQLTESLYFQSLDSNLGVFHQVFDEAEEQESREILLAYYFLWQNPGPDGLTMRELDRRIEAYLRTSAGIEADFEKLDALRKLERQGLVTRQAEGKYLPVPIAEAIRKMRDATMRISEDAALPVADAPERGPSPREAERELLQRIELDAG